MVSEGLTLQDMEKRESEYIQALAPKFRDAAKALFEYDPWLVSLVDANEFPILFREIYIADNKDDAIDILLDEDGVGRALASANLQHCFDYDTAFKEFLYSEEIIYENGYVFRNPELKSSVIVSLHGRE